MVKYYISKTDKNGYTYSIDNCIFEYYLCYQSKQEELIEYCHELCKIHNLQDEFWERRDLTPCSHYGWATDVIHLCKGIYLSIGKVNYVKDKKEPIFVPYCKLEINLNKHGLKPVFSDLNEWLIRYSDSIYLIKYDFALDIPAKLNEVEVLKSRKERGLYKGTRYYGQRNKHGYCKIYDKSKEMQLDSDLTRVEHTLLYNNIPSLENIYVKSNNCNMDKLKDTDICIIEMLNTLGAYGEDKQKFLDMLGRGKKQLIIESMNGYKLKQIEYDFSLVTDLLEEIRTVTKFKDPVKPIFEDVNGFIHVNDQEPLPFD